MKTNNFRVDVTDMSAKKEALIEIHQEKAGVWGGHESNPGHLADKKSRSYRGLSINLTPLNRNPV